MRRLSEQMRSNSENTFKSAAFGVLNEAGNVQRRIRQQLSKPSATRPSVGELA
ncbi:hypothetical protein BAUCODRAFT_411596 [Baudoinia panamericana UAMH 10762]|uniref:Uncharacterized protein n=1 Tax=Baudoinia panamericana (strain UAMH 10762) TaxID=717646 RepID=M2NGD8_BAUPA|nr:uncharacterized protein BAUCODRAFT_411596 [Baudoinia panamericana UAMH 10762]EMC98045.1 hypothetical protein BAUCODRAFT_411596 [Baudoinia panamericana UAMH 10762]